MSKRFKGKICVYCATPVASETGDHVLAREFVRAVFRSQIPQVPACRQCNKNKADLEHYLTAVLLFGGRHADAATNLETEGPRRFAKNQKLGRQLAKGRARLWTREPSGLVVNALTLPIDGEKIEKLVEFMARGLMSPLESRPWARLLCGRTDSYVERRGPIPKIRENECQGPRQG